LLIESPLRFSLLSCTMRQASFSMSTSPSGIPRRLSTCDKYQWSLGQRTDANSFAEVAKRLRCPAVALAGLQAVQPCSLEMGRFGDGALQVLHAAWQRLHERRSDCRGWKGVWQSQRWLSCLAQLRFATFALRGGASANGGALALGGRLHSLCIVCTGVTGRVLLADRGQKVKDGRGLNA